MTTTTVIDRAEAVRRIATAIADRTHFTVSVPPTLVASVATELTRLTDWTAYVDSGLPAVVRTSEPSAMAAITILVTATAVITVPKTIPAADLSEALGEHIPDDGSRDIVLLHEGEDVPMAWPLLFIDAIELVDPAAAAQIRIYDRTLQS